MPIFNKPHTHLFLGFYYSVFYLICKKCKINSKEFHLTMVQLNPVKLVKDEMSSLCVTLCLTLGLTKQSLKDWK